MNTHDQHDYLLGDIVSTQHAIEKCIRENPSVDPDQFRLGGLTGLLKSMAGLDGYPLHGSVFSSDVTEAIKALLRTIEDEHEIQRVLLSRLLAEDPGGPQAHRDRPNKIVLCRLPA